MAEYDRKKGTINHQKTRMEFGILSTAAFAMLAVSLGAESAQILAGSAPDVLQSALQFRDLKYHSI